MNDQPPFNYQYFFTYSRASSWDSVIAPTTSANSVEIG